MLLGDALIAHVDPLTLDALEKLASELDDPSKAEATITRALNEVFDGPLVRQLRARPSRLRRENLNDATRAATDQRKLHDLSPNDQGVIEELTALFAELGDHRGLVALIEDQILRGKDMTARAELARTVARMWQNELADPREAADAWRRVLRMKAGDADATAGLERAKVNMLRKPAAGGESTPSLPSSPAPAARSVPPAAPSSPPAATDAPSTDAALTPEASHATSAEAEAPAAAPSAPVVPVAAESWPQPPLPVPPAPASSSPVDDLAASMRAVLAPEREERTDAHVSPGAHGPASEDRLHLPEGLLFRPLAEESPDDVPTAEPPQAGPDDAEMSDLERTYAPGLGDDPTETAAAPPAEADPPLAGERPGSEPPPVSAVHTAEGASERTGEHAAARELAVSTSTSRKKSSSPTIWPRWSTPTTWKRRRPPSLRPRSSRRPSGPCRRPSRATDTTGGQAPANHGRSRRWPRSPSMPRRSRGAARSRATSPTTFSATSIRTRRWASSGRSLRAYAAPRASTTRPARRS